MKKLFLFSIYLLFFNNNPLQANSALYPVNLSCEYLVNPSAIDIKQPRLSWINELTDSLIRCQGQTAFQIRVASSLKKLEQEDIDLWDSGIQPSAESVLIKYEGIVLKSAQECFWQVRVWDKNNQVSAWSQPASWTMGILTPQEWHAEWIGAPWQSEEKIESTFNHTHFPAPLLRKSFKITKEIVSAKAFVSGLGYFEFYVNGEKISQDVLSPNQTNYGKREGLNQARVPIDDKFRAYRVMYLGYDITKYIQTGNNVIGCILGNGFYNALSKWTKAYGSPRFIGEIRILYRDGSEEIIKSDKSWLAHSGPIILDGIYEGEIYDARLEYPHWTDTLCDLTEWDAVALRQAPEGNLTAQNGPPDRIMETLKPLSIVKINNEYYEVDFGEKISGWIHLYNIQGKIGDSIEIKYLSESPNGCSKYFIKGSENESYAPRFTWFVFQKVQIKNWHGNLTTDCITAEAVYSNLETIGHFECSNPLFNQINQIWKRSQTDNMHGSIASDCPHRERSAYTGDGQICCATVMNNYDAAAFYNKWIQDIHDAQNTETGYVPNGAPWQPGCGGGVAWGAAMNIIPWEFYKHYGDIDILTRNYEAMKQQTDYMTTWQTKDGTMLSKIQKNGKIIQWLNLGEWCSPFELPSDELIHTFYWWYCTDIMAKTAKVLHQTEDANLYTKRSEEIKQAFYQKFYQPEKQSYGKNGSNILALKMGIPEDYRPLVIESLRQEIADCGNHLNTGIFGTRFFFEVLAENELNNLAYSVMNQRSFPSFGYWIEQGATTTWEQWDGKNSRNHPMFGGGLTWFYQKLAGIEIDENIPGYKHIIIKPILADSLNFVKYSLRTPYGKTAVSWQKTQKSFDIQIIIPAGSTATIYLPVTNSENITENRKKLKKAIGISNLKRKSDCITFNLEQGNYYFKVF